jgi:hypothetical protein
MKQHKTRQDKDKTQAKRRQGGNACDRTKDKDKNYTRQGQREEDKHSEQVTKTTHKDIDTTQTRQAL